MNLPKKRLISIAVLLAIGETPKGFRRFTSTYRQMQAYYNRELGVVVKRHTNILDPRTPLALRVPTVRLFDNWVAQPLVFKAQLRRAVNIIERKLKRYPRYRTDVHVGNVGWYNGKAVLFDW